jgi:putative N-acetylmannosamine-6-phosphate epimerase
MQRNDAASMIESRSSGESRLKALRGRLIVSCQPVVGGPMDRPEIVAAYARAALAGGAAGLRIEGIANLAAVRAATTAPIIGLVKRTVRASPVFITPEIADVIALAGAGADIVAVDATLRPRPINVADLVAAIHSAGRLAMADIARVEEAHAAAAQGADVIATTLSSYTGGAVPDEPDLDLLRSLRDIGVPVIAEGRIRTPAEAAEAIRLGALAVVVGSAITRPEHIAGWFAAAIANA